MGRNESARRGNSETSNRQERTGIDFWKESVAPELFSTTMIFHQPQSTLSPSPNYP